MKLLFTVIFSLSCFISNAQREIPPTTEFKVTGDIKAERTFTISNLEKQKSISLGDISIKNHKGEEKSVAKNVKGILVKTLLDSIGISVEKPKELSQFCFMFVASDGYRNVYSWNEIYNTEVGNKLYIITEKDGKGLAQMEGRILVLSMADFNTGSRYLKGLTSIEVKKMK